MQTLKEVVKELNRKREDTLEAIGEVIQLAATAGDLIGKHKDKGDDMAAVLGQAGITDEEGKRYVRVAVNRHKLADADPAIIRQMFLFSGMLPDPIVTSLPSAPKSETHRVIALSQWLSSGRGERLILSTEERQREYVDQMAGPVRLWVKCGGKL